MSNKLHKKKKNKENSIVIHLPNKKRQLFLTVCMGVLFVVISVWLFIYCFIVNSYHNELGKKTLRCDNFTTLNINEDGVFTWTFDNRPNEKLNGLFQIYFGDNAIKYIIDNEKYFGMTKEDIEGFFDGVNYKKEDFFAMKIKGFYYNSAESVTGLLNSDKTRYYFGFELDNNRLQAISPSEVEILVFEYVD